MCSTALRLRISILNPPVERLLVFIGHAGDDKISDTRGAVASRVAHHMLQVCAPAPSDVHNPERGRFHARDAKGMRRRQGSHGHKHFFYSDVVYGDQRSRKSIRNPQVWDSEPALDYMGIWCDRLLLGIDTNPLRCALLEPQVPPLMRGESLERVILSQRRLKRSNVLLIFGSCCFPFGSVQLMPFSDTLFAPQLPGSSVYNHLTLGTVLKRLIGPPSVVSAMVLGIGNEHGSLSPFSLEEKSLIEDRIVPLSSFACALWTVDPLKASKYLESNPPNNSRLWRTMHSSMLSTRDTAIIRAYQTGQSPDARMSQQQVTYLAETLLSRIFPHDTF
ncbi:hypothetical protein ERJ75_000645800 [Trypanosoma vivax]|uniref:Uncharacterized protein n=1 Tax=Trypanosoma vivax (strain Y486) TaxID=1055687 RepID=G0U805_TRYVY|nr:hypothetical protein TRVL_06439 [Trypanosoma vivax]KAH8606227.1 hypothetical protein ERJ75_001535400 [Trypanosoma vivax]KAH8614860.1 hypothetical protein ERJ75_000645800 [Trypanosoma vivax]CCC52013.1 conserved hypothetical protein [Trypanosoma vivax Y486]